MPDRKTKTYHPWHFPDPDDPDSVGGFVVAANNGDRAYHLVVEDCRAREWRRVVFEYRHGDQCGELKPINLLASNVESWFHLHCGMVKDASRIQDYLNLLSFKLSCPGNALKKAETLLKTMLDSKEILRFRAEFPTNSDF